MDKPVFLISLDTELLWGPTGIGPLNYVKKSGTEIRKKISILIDIFEKYKIPVTWAIVGHLFLESCDKETCLTARNMNKYGYKRQWYVDPYSNIKQDPLFYGKDIIEEILSNSINHEIGYHSFSHPRFIEISREMAEDEIKESKKIEKEWGIKFSSFVFPVNEIAYVDILKENGFKIYRGKPAGINTHSKNLLINKVGGGVNKLIAPPVEPRWRDGIWEIQSSMFFSELQIPQSLLIRSKFGLDRSIKNRKLFHIWFHPWSLLRNKRLKDDLEQFLKYVNNKRKNGKLEVMTMGELAEYLNSEKR